MKLKPLEVGDDVKVKYIVDIHGNEGTTYIDGKLIKEDGHWLVEYQLDGVKHQNYWHESDITSKHYLATTDVELFEKAEKIAASDYTGMVFYDDRYFDDISEVLDHCECTDQYVPKFVWACDASPVKLTPDLVDMIKERLDEEGYEGLSERSQLHPLYDELRIVEEKIVAMAAKETVYYPNYNLAVVL
jgi:hypothetical protein